MKTIHSNLFLISSLTYFAEIFMKLILVRHGETDFNAKNLMIGVTDAPLNKKGRKQAEKLVQRLKDEKIDVFFSSPLLRARETAETINKNHSKKIIFESVLKERNFGVLEGVSTKTFRDTIKKQGGDFFNFVPENGESDKDVVERIKPFINWLINKYEDKSVLVVAHGVVIMAVLFYLTHRKPEQWQELRQSNASLNIIEIDKKSHKVIMINNIDHL